MNTLDSLLKTYCILSNRPLSRWTEVYNSLAFLCFCADSLNTTMWDVKESSVYKDWILDKDEDAYFLYGIVGA